MEEPWWSSTAADGDFAFLFVGQAEGGGARDLRMGDDGFFKLANVDGVAAGLDDIFDAADEADEAEAIAGGEIAGAEPAVVGEQFLVADFVFPVMRGETAAANLALAGDAGADGAAVFIGYANFEMAARGSRGRRFQAKVTVSMPIIARPPSSTMP